MGKYRDHRERRGKRHDNHEAAFSDRIFEPTHFQETPSVTPSAVDAEVLWFNAAKGFGFVKLSDGSEVYLHIRVLEAAGGHDLADGTHLKVIVEQGARGRQVVKVLDIGPQSPKTSAGERRAEISAVEGNTQSQSQGTVKWYNSEKGFGFITPESGENDIFVHATALTRSGIATLEEGQRVLFQSGQGKKGMEIKTIRLA